MSQFSLVSESNEKGDRFLFRWSLNLKGSIDSLIYGTTIWPEIAAVDFWHIRSPKEGLVESIVLDDVKNDLVSIFLLSRSGINSHVCGTDLDSVSFRNTCLFTSNLLNFLLIHDSA
ncbi:hypothetical protein Tco_0655245 [Tanacetum coccineum]|uniref:Uncharacterized protein n=1 Tax=Tanacetum coccineum TaxID=301880 RepID=A0ABQ4X5H3_9ASTR